jgi:hypothetical protein
MFVLEGSGEINITLAAEGVFTDTSESCGAPWAVGCLGAILRRMKGQLSISIVDAGSDVVLGILPFAETSSGTGCTCWCLRGATRVLVFANRIENSRH